MQESNPTDPIFIMGSHTLVGYTTVTSYRKKQTDRNLFSFLLDSKRLAKNPLFEVISLHGPTGPLGNKNFLAMYASKLKPSL
jgi:hypothetical protein